jgi:hypothetical protein
MSAVGEKKYKACEENEYKISIQRFAGILVNQLIEQAKKIGGPPQRFLPEESVISGLEVQLMESGSFCLLQLL